MTRISLALRRYYVAWSTTFEGQPSRNKYVRRREAVGILILNGESVIQDKSGQVGGGDTMV